MFTNKASWSILGLAFVGLVIVLLIGLVLLAVFVVDELAENGWAVSSWMHIYFTYREARMASSGDELTGEMTALLFGASGIPIGIDLISRAVIRHVPFRKIDTNRVRGFIRRFNNGQRKYLMPFHTYLSILALGMGILHLILSSCAANPLPELGLILSGVLVTSGLLFKWKAVPAKFRKALHRFHASLIV
jgi:hypothetical protein